MNKNKAVLLMFVSLVMTIVSGGILLATTSLVATTTFLLGATAHIYSCCQYRAAHYHHRMYDARW